MAIREVFRYRNGARTRSYGLRTGSDESSELWVNTDDGRRGRNARKLVTFERFEDIEPFLEDVRRELRAGGWTEQGHL